jgi:hypothetical protein
MILVGPHAEAVARVVGEFVPLAEATFPMLRRPLSERLTNNLRAIDLNLRPHARSILFLYRIPPNESADGALEAMEVWAQAIFAGRLRAFIAALDRDAKMSIATFIGDLLGDMVAAIEIYGRYKSEGGAGKDPALWAAPAAAPEIDAASRALNLPPKDVEAMFRGDAAFRTLVTFLDHARDVLKSVAPRSIIAARST